MGHLITRTCYLLSLIFCTSICSAQTKHAYYGEVITKIDHTNDGTDTSRLLYCRNAAGNRLSVYLVRDGIISEAAAYRLFQTSKGLCCERRSLTLGEQTKESLRITFEDQSTTVVINKTDRYTLFPAYYVTFKKEVRVRRSIMAFLNLLSDAIGDYSIADVQPLLRYTPKLTKQISKARIVTQRSQADMKDTWTCKYDYNKHGQLDSVSAFSPEEIRFSKKNHYRQSKITSIITNSNIESRQTTNRFITYDISNPSTLKWQEQVFQTGKNWETLFSVTLIKDELGMLKKMEPSRAEVLELLKPAK